jgi:membrane protein DedA with SNARE-associated domain/rhodanese-related sulfurtransferase
MPTGGGPFSLLVEYGLALVFANVLLEQVGLPVPAVPTLIMSGALAAEGKASLAALFAVATVACLIGDGIWYIAGRRYGLGVLRVLCKVSLSPDSCVRQTESRFGRWGSTTLVFGKFIPGVSTVAPPLAGAMRIGWARFLFFNTIGILLWVGVAVGLGYAFHAQLAALLERFAELGAVAVQIVVVLLAAFVAFKWWERQKLFRALRLARITVSELKDLMDAGRRPVVVDVRAPNVRAIDGRFIPGALEMDLADLDRRSGEIPADGEVVFYCSCPNDASAAAAAKRLIDLGFKRVRPLAGGIDEWIAAGYDVESRTARREVELP